MDLKVLVHKIHRGTALSRQPYNVWSLPAPTVLNPSGTPFNYGTVSYPGDLRSCEACHLPNTYNIPLAQGLLPSRENEFACIEDPAMDTDNYCNIRVIVNTTQTWPTTASCTSCHDAPYTAAHAATMTAPGGQESCTTCHTIGASNGIEIYHLLPP
jgi:OmcA/MtrC family decaheme c-type cytochrome